MAVAPEVKSFTERPQIHAGQPDPEKGDSSISAAFLMDLERLPCLEHERIFRLRKTAGAQESGLKVWVAVNPQKGTSHAQCRKDYDRLADSRLVGRPLFVLADPSARKASILPRKRNWAEQKPYLGPACGRPQAGRPHRPGTPHPGTGRSRLVVGSFRGAKTLRQPTGAARASRRALTSTRATLEVDKKRLAIINECNIKWGHAWNPGNMWSGASKLAKVVVEDPGRRSSDLPLLGG